MIFSAAHTQRTSGPASLTGKAAIVTRGASTVGQGVAQRLAESGASVMLVDDDLETVSQLAQLLRAEGGRAEALQADSWADGNVARVIQATKEAFTRIDMLVLNSSLADRNVTILSRAVAQEIIDSGIRGKIVVITCEGVALPAEQRFAQSRHSKAAAAVFLAEGARVNVTFSQDPFGNVIEITSNVGAEDQ